MNSFVISGYCPKTNQTWFFGYRGGWVVRNLAHVYYSYAAAQSALRNRVPPFMGTMENVHVADCKA